MPLDIKLDCYAFSIKKRGNNSRLDFSDFYDSLKPENQPNASLGTCYNLFYGELLNYFGEEFRVNKLETKGLTIKSNDNISVLSQGNTISGFFRGGSTGVGKTIQERDNAQVGDDAHAQKIHSMPHYFLIWTPLDMNYAIVIIQSYKNEIISGLFVKHLEDYFKTKRIVCSQKRKILPTSMVDDFRNHAAIKSVTLSTTSVERSRRTAINPVLTEKEKLKIDLVIKGFGSDTRWDEVKAWVRKPVRSFIGVDLSDLDLETDFDRIVEYNYQGKNSKGKLSKEFDIIPSLIITSEIEIDTKNHPVFESIDEYAKNFLIDLKTEIGYTPVQTIT